MTDPRRIRAIIVDDEPLAREHIRVLLASTPRVAVVAECGDGASAVDAIRKHRPDLVFLDVQMPEMDGFDVIAALPSHELPRVIFVTAYDQHALRAFEVGALDYLLKPFDRQRFIVAIERVIGAIDGDSAGRESASSGGLRDVLVFKSAGQVLFLPLREIEHVRAAGNYVEIHAGGASHLLRETMSAMESRLDPARFIRISRSAIVAVPRIHALQPGPSGDGTVTLNNGVKLQLSRRYRDTVASRLGIDC